jgi:PKD repeat protein
VTPPRPSVNESVTFNGSVSTDADGTIVTYTWQFGDAIAATGLVVTHVYDRPGTYPVQLTVTDEDGMSSANTSHLFVVGLPHAAFVFTPTRPNVNQAVTFTAAGSSDVSGIRTYNWTFGDGTSASGYEVNKTYVAPGTYRVTLNVTNSFGYTNRSSQVVVVGTPTGAGTTAGSAPGGAALLVSGVLDVLAAIVAGAYVYVVVRRARGPRRESKP